MIVNFFEERKKKSSYEIQRRLNVEQATHIFYSFTKKQAAQLAYELNRYEWNTDLLGEYQGIDYAMELTELFNAFTSDYEIFKYECVAIDGMTDDQVKEAVLEKMFNNISRLMRQRR